ncbi:MAG: hypothetical protein CMB83_01010 [Flammeovirgaceae bacterium]|mgnify:FL=1|nr:hypothetical protein [Flammeovirgaceae bacterium]|tara:strand:+ start:6719 stop:7117 length:399 start_codon:yes stop_codon:yes gene_type:complete
MKVEIEVSFGELLDKLSILEIKSTKITDPNKLKNINNELSKLKKISKKIKEQNAEKFDLFYMELLETNNKLWTIEDEIRICEKNNNFDNTFIKLARDVYFTNDERFKIKNEINKFYNSGVIEEKEYIEYDSN